MLYKCPICKKDCKPIGINVIGLEIQEYKEKKGWVSTKEVYPTGCHAKTALSLIPKDKIERRIYSVYENRKHSIFESIQA